MKTLVFIKLEDYRNWWSTHRIMGSSRRRISKTNQGNLENDTVINRFEEINLHPILKKGNSTRHTHYCTITISQSSRIMLKIIQCRLQPYMVKEMSFVQADPNSLFLEMFPSPHIQYSLSKKCYIPYNKNWLERNLFFLCFLPHSRNNKIIISFSLFFF